MALDKGYVLTPERYDPRRIRQREVGVSLNQFVDERKELLAPSMMKNMDSLLVLDTNNAKDGFLQIDGTVHENRKIKSTKKIIRKGDVIISRLRPYLRQIGAVWGAPDLERQNMTICVSTEFYVLKGKKEEVLWIVPFLLSDKVQEIIRAAQEGGHHPRFNSDTLLNLHIPEKIMTHKEYLNEEVKRAAEEMHQARKRVQSLVTGAIDEC